MSASTDLNSLLLIQSVVTVNPSDDDFLTKEDLCALDDHETIKLRMLVSTPLLGCVIGRGGESINEIRAVSGAAVHVLKNADQLEFRVGFEPASEDTVIRIAGNHQTVSAAQQLITMVLAEKEAPGSARTTLRFLAPLVCSGLLIGKGGDTVRALSDRTRARIRVIKLDSPCMFATRDCSEPELIVSADGSKEALRHLQLLVTSMAHAAVRSNTGLSSVRTRRPTTAVDPGPVVEEAFTLPLDRVGDVIGRGGRRIQEFSRLSGALIHISKDIVPSSGECAVTIKGTRAAILRARDLIGEHFARATAAAASRSEAEQSAEFRGPATAAAAARMVPTQAAYHAPLLGAAQDTGGPATVAVLTVPAPALGALIGRRGANIQAMQTRTHAHLHLARDPHADPAAPVPLEISGAAAAVAAAKLEVANCVEAALAAIASAQAAAASSMGGAAAAGVDSGAAQ